MAEWTLAVTTEEVDNSLSTEVPAAPAAPGVHGYCYWYAGMVICYSVLTIICLIGNLMTVFAYYLTPSMHNPHHLLICQLSIVDLVVATMATPFIILNYTQAGMEFIRNDKYICLICLWMIAASINMSLMSIFTLSLERFIAVYFPYRYYNISTERSVKRAMAGSCIFSVLSTAVPLVVPTKWQTGIPCFNMHVHPTGYNMFINVTRTIILITTAVLNIAIARMALLKKEVPLNAVSNSSDKTGETPKDPSQDYKITRMLLTVVGLFYACWIPYVILTAAFRFNPNPSTIFEISYDYSKILVGLNSCLNPLIYAKRNEHFRGAFKRIFVRLGWSLRRN